MTMPDTDRINRFSMLLAAAAGFIDAVGWLRSGGLFVSFMSGNVTKLGVSLAGRLDAAALGAGLIGSFVGGVIIGSLLGRRVGRLQPAAVLWLVSLLLALATLAIGTGGMVAGVLGLAAAMGAKNTVFAEDGEVKIGITYMTGALVRTGKRIATALDGGDRLGWLLPASLFSSMLAGAAAGALAEAWLGAGALWLATSATAGLAMFATVTRLGRQG